MKASPKKGFTLVELAISLTVISILLLVIAQFISGIVESYTKGLTVKAINSTARDLIEDLTTTITSAPARNNIDMCSLNYIYSSDANSPYDQCQKDDAYLFIYNERYATNVTVDGSTIINKPVPISGAFCTGKYSYIWNTGYILNKKTYSVPADYPVATIKYRDTSNRIINYPENESKSFRLIRFLDLSRVACSSRIKDGSYNKISDSVGTYDLTSDASGNDYYLTSEIEELLSADENDLALYDLQIFHPATNNSTFRSYYTGAFILGTLRGSVNIRANGDYCKAPADYESDFDYCAINKFNFAARAIGG